MLAIEGPDFEDSLFEKGDTVTIGEAKYIKSRKNWTQQSLFYSGSKKGPLLQLWNRWTGLEKLILFSPISTTKRLRDLFRMSESERVEFLKKMCSKVSGIKRKAELCKDGFDMLIAQTRVEPLRFEHLNQTIIDWAGFYGVKSNRERVSELASYFSSVSYNPGKWMSLESILAILAEERDTPLIIHREFNFEVLLSNRMADRLYFVLLWPRTSIEATKVAYGENSHAYFESVKHTISELLKAGFVKEVGANHDQIVFQSTYKPVFDYCRKNILSRSKTSKKSDYGALTGSDEIIFKDFFTSNCFSQLLSNYYRCFHLNISKNQGLDIYESIKEIADFLEVLNQITACFAHRSKIKSMMPVLADYDFSNGFDEFSNRWIAEHFRHDWIDSYIEEILKGARRYLGNYACTKKLLDLVRGSKEILCIPEEFADKMTHAHRIQLTIAIAFCDSM